MATSRGLLVVTNMHHDSWAWADVSSSGGKNTTLIREKFYAGWLQIATKLACKPSTVAFEPINEPPGSTAEDAERLMGLNDLFIHALRDSGGWNSQRVVTLSALNMGGADRMQNGWFRLPKNMTNPWAFQFHYYSPYDFIFQAWGKTVWGSESDKVAVVADLEAVRGNLTAITNDLKVPIYLGEFDASQLSLEAAARWRWFDTVVSAARRLNIVPVLWDNGLDNLQRETGRWRDEVAVEIIVNAIKGKKNSLPESTTDGGATTQESSAYVFNKVGEDIGAEGRNLSFALNGNRFKALSVGGVPLKAGKDYAVQEQGTVTLKKEFLGKYLSRDAAPGTKANITVTFSAGAKSRVEIVQWDLPVPAQTISSGSAVPAGQDLSVPVVWKGLHRVAAVKMIKADGSYLFDDWTMWLPGLQKGRGVSVPLSFFSLSPSLSADSSLRPSANKKADIWWPVGLRLRQAHHPEADAGCRDCFRPKCHAHVRVLSACGRERELLELYPDRLIIGTYWGISLVVSVGVKGIYRTHGGVGSCATTSFFFPQLKGRNLACRSSITISSCCGCCSS